MFEKAKKEPIEEPKNNTVNFLEEIENEFKEHNNKTANEDTQEEIAQENNSNIETNNSSAGNQNFDPAKRQPEIKGNAKDVLGEFIDAEIIITLADLILSRLLTFCFRKFMKADVTAGDFELDKKEIEIISIQLEKVLLETPVRMKPKHALMLSIVGIYSSKFVFAFTAQKIVHNKSMSDLTEHTNKGKKGTGRGRPPGSKNKPKTFSIA